MKKILVIVLLFFSCSLQSMQEIMRAQPTSKKMAQKMLVRGFIEHQKGKSKDIEERELTTQAFVQNIDNIVIENGFNSTERQELAKTNDELRMHDVNDDQTFIGLYELARFANVLLSKIATKQPKSMPIYLEQTFVLGRLSTLAAKIACDQLDEEILSQQMSEYYVVSPRPKITAQSPFAKKSHKTSKKVRIQEPEDSTPRFILAEIPKAQLKAVIANPDKFFEEDLEEVA